MNQLSILCSLSLLLFKMVVVLIGAARELNRRKQRKQSTPSSARSFLTEESALMNQLAILCSLSLLLFKMVVVLIGAARELNRRKQRKQSIPSSARSFLTEEGALHESVVNSLFSQFAPVQNGRSSYRCGEGIEQEKTEETEHSFISQELPYRRKCSHESVVNSLFSQFTPVQNGRSSYRCGEGIEQERTEETEHSFISQELPYRRKCSHESVGNSLFSQFTPVQNC